jgi:hypothetical protein
MRTEEPADMTKLRVAFRDFAKKLAILAARFAYQILNHGEAQH